MRDDYRFKLACCDRHAKVLFANPSRVSKQFCSDCNANADRLLRRNILHIARMAVDPNTEPYLRKRCRDTLDALGITLT